MDVNSPPCYIYRAESDESEGELTTLGMLIPTENNILPNDIRYVYLLPMERKRLVYERVYNLLGDPPSDLMLPTFQQISDGTTTLANTIWTYVSFNCDSTESDVLTTFKSLKESVKPTTLYEIVVRVSDYGFFWNCRFSDVLREYQYCDNYNSIIAETA